MRNRNIFSQRGAGWCNKPQEQSSVILCSRPDLRAENASVVNFRFICFWRLALSLNAIIIRTELNWANSDWAMMEEYICQCWKRVGGVCTADDRPDMCLIVLEAKGCTSSNLNEGPQEPASAWLKWSWLLRSGLWGLSSCSQMFLEAWLALVLVTDLLPGPLTPRGSAAKAWRRSPIPWGERISCKAEAEGKGWKSDGDPAQELVQFSTWLWGES